MPALQSAVGMIYAPRDVVVTPRMALAYAAGMGLLDDRHLNDADGARLCVAPTLCVSLEWMISGDSRNRASLGLSDEERARAVHAGQDTRFLRPLPVNAPLVVSGEVAGLSSTRAGARLTSVLRVSDKSSDEVISESRIDTIFRGVSTDAPPASPAGGGEAQPAVRSELMREQLFPISRGFPHIYTECASIWNPIHTERRAALAAGLPDIIVHGTALWALGYVALNRPGWRLSRLAGRFSAMAIPGQSVRLRHSGDHDSGFAFEVLNAAGDRAVSAGAVEFEMET